MLRGTEGDGRIGISSNEDPPERLHANERGAPVFFGSFPDHQFKAPFMKTVFGPVPSRRLGRSLGIDVVPSKTCSYDCVYCESGRTSHLTLKRRAFVPPERVMADLEDYFRNHPDGADVLTFSSAGEPTLYEPLGELIRDIKKRYPRLPLVVLTNGSLLWDPQTRKSLLAADRVVPSVDAVTRDVFTRVNRPHPDLDLPAILEGMAAFRREYRGELHVEVMVVAGINDSAEELKAIARVVERLGADEVELNTVVRPPADLETEGLSPAEMAEVSSFFPKDRTRIIGCFQGVRRGGQDMAVGGRVLELVRRRPCTASEMAASLGVSAEELEEALDGLLKENRLVRRFFNDREYLCTPAGE